MAGTNTPRIGLYKADIDDFATLSTDINNNYDKIAAGLPTTLCLSNARPVAPYSGQMIYETDTFVTRIWDTSSARWRQLGMPSIPTVNPPANPLHGDLWQQAGAAGTNGNDFIVNVYDATTTTWLPYLQRTGYSQALRTAGTFTVNAGPYVPVDFPQGLLAAQPNTPQAGVMAAGNTGIVINKSGLYSIIGQAAFTPVSACRLYTNVTIDDVLFLQSGSSATAGSSHVMQAPFLTYLAAGKKVGVSVTANGSSGHALTSAYIWVMGPL